MNIVTRWLSAALIALLLSSTYLLDGPSEIEAAQAVSADLQDAIESVAISAGAERARDQTDHKTVIAAVRP